MMMLWLVQTVRLFALDSQHNLAPTPAQTCTVSREQLMTYRLAIISVDRTPAVSDRSSSRQDMKLYRCQDVVMRALSKNSALQPGHCCEAVH